MILKNHTMIYRKECCAGKFWMGCGCVFCAQRRMNWFDIVAKRLQSAGKMTEKGVRKKEILFC